MSSSIRTETGPKRQRIMVIIDDDSIIDQIGKSNNVFLLKQNVFPSDGSKSERNDKESTTQSSHKNDKSKNDSLICVVCGSSAHGFNFGAVACESCKAFFRRHTRETPITFHCKHNGDCQIILETRRDCVACRLAKCFNNGMKRDRLSTNEQKALKRRQLQENRDLALISNEEDLQLSSSTFANDLFSLIDSNLLLTDFTHLLLPQFQQTLLTPEDLQRVETISLFYQKRIELADRDGLPWNPSTHTNTFLQVLNSHSVTIMRLLAFLKQIPEFNQLNVDDKVTLIKYNLPAALNINSTLHYNTETNQLIEHASDLPFNTQFFQTLHGHQNAKYDRRIIELTIIILIFTKGLSIINDYDEKILRDNTSVYQAQSYYTELLWKYLETIHGYEKAIDLFSKLILHIMSWQTIQEQIRNDVLRTLSPEDITDLVPIMKSLMHLP